MSKTLKQTPLSCVLGLMTILDEELHINNAQWSVQDCIIGTVHYTYGYMQAGAGPTILSTSHAFSMQYNSLLTKYTFCFVTNGTIYK